MKNDLLFVCGALFFVFGIIGCSLPAASGDENQKVPAERAVGAKLIVRRDTVSLQSLYNDKFLCADLNYGPNAPLYANRDAVGYDANGNSWELFDLIEYDDGTYALKAHATWKYVCAENNGTSRAVANRDSAQEWETFYVSIDVNRYGTFCNIKYPVDYGKYFNYATMIPDTKKNVATCFRIQVFN